jgi:3-hydroxyacyl-CoA dehydrogenase
MRVRQAAVLGAGVMGAQIAAHLANGGVRVRLLDVSRQAARAGLERAVRLTPDPFFTTSTVALVETGAFDEDLTALGSADWIIEAIVERVDAKQGLLARVDEVRRADAIVSSNTSGIPIASMAAGRSESFRRHWLGTHFFNPPRYLHLLELIPTPETDPAVIRDLTTFADVRLGKGVVVAKDVAGFIANRIGLFGLMRVFEAIVSGEYTIEEVDAVTGPAIGRPKSATFRTADIAGIDVIASVARTLGFALPAFIEEMLAKGLIGAKAGAGFYKKAGDEILTLDLATLEYRAKQPAKLPPLDAARSIENAGERIRILYDGQDKVGAFLRATLGPTLDYVQQISDEIAYSHDDVDRAMRWGYGWDLGPFETLRAINSPLRTPQLSTSSRTPTANTKVIKSNAGTSLVDIGDGVVQIEFHSKMNVIGGDTMEMIRAGVREAAMNFAAIVVANGAANFSAGANLLLLLLEAQEGNWDDIDLMVRTFQAATMALKHADVPVVVAPAGQTLGGACETTLHASRVQAAAESYIGLVETGVGLVPAGGGTKEMLARATEGLPPGAELLPPVQRVFETIGLAKVSKSAAQARELGFLRDGDAISMNRDRLLEDAKAAALLLARDFTPAQPRTAIRVGGEPLLAALKLGVHLAWRAGRISDHDALIGRKLAWILAGGDLHHPATLSEQQLLDLEREAFLSLCGERKTLDRIAHTLKSGKALRN